MKNIVFIAPPAAGKGTQSKKICDAYHVPHISIGDLLREEVETGSDFGKELQRLMEQGILVDDQIILKLLQKRIAQSDCMNGYVLDGYPRSISQAISYDSMLDEVGKSIDFALLMDLDYNTAKKRITGRQSCPNCGRVFNTEIEHLKPKVEGICDICKDVLIKRKDDNEESFDKRYNTYTRETFPLIEYYEKKDILKRVDSNRDAEDIFTDIQEILGDDL